MWQLTAHDAFRNTDLSTLYKISKWLNRVHIYKISGGECGTRIDHLLSTYLNNEIERAKWKEKKNKLWPHTVLKIPIFHRFNNNIQWKIVELVFCLLFPILFFSNLVFLFWNCYNIFPANSSTKSISIKKNRFEFVHALRLKIVWIRLWTYLMVVYALPSS